MKRITYSLFLLLMCNFTVKGIESYNISNLIQHEFSTTTNHFIQRVFRRFYYIERLKKTMELFFALDKNLQTKSAALDYKILFNLDTLPFQHEKIKKSINAMKEKRSLKPLFLVWNNFAHYQSINDLLLVEEFTKEILVISRNLIISSRAIPNEKQKLLYSNFFKSIALPSCTLLDIIDNYISLFLQYNPNIARDIKNKPYTAPQTKKLNRIVDLKPFVHVNEVIERFYHIQRLAYHIKTLTKVCELPINITMEYDLKNSALQLHNLISFSHPTITSSIKAMNQIQAIYPLIELWNDLEQYKYIHDTLFVREFFLLVYVTLLEIYTLKSHEKVNKNYDSLLETIQSLPLENILHAIDILASDLPKLLDKYELKSNLSWKEWFKKYWWAPPLIGVTLTCKILLAIKISKLFMPKTA